MWGLKAALFYARKDIFQDKKIFFFIVVAITVATANIIIMNGIMNGMTDDLVDNTVKSSVGHLNIYPEEEDRFVRGLGIKEMSLNEIDAVAAISPRLAGSGTLTKDEHSIGVAILAVDPALDAKVTSMLTKLDEGKTLVSGDRNNILVSNRLAEDFDITVGDDITLVYENGNKRSYNTKGIIHTGVSGTDASTVIMTLDTARREMGLPDVASTILVNLVDKDLADQYKPVVKAELDVSNVRTWGEEVSHIIMSMGEFKRLINTVVSVGLVAAAITVAVVIYVNIVHKRRQIGILKALGMRNRQVFYIFVIEALLMGIIGVLLGDMLGYAGVKYFETHPFYDPVFKEYYRPTFYNYLLYEASAVSLVVSLLAGIYPAMKASSLSIIKAIWG